MSGSIVSDWDFSNQSGLHKDLWLIITIIFIKTMFRSRRNNCLEHLNEVKLW